MTWSVTDDPPADWALDMDALNGGTVYAGRAWMRYQARAAGCTTQYLVVRDGTGVALALLPLYLVERESSDEYRIGSLLPVAAGRRGDAEQPTLLVGNRRGYSNRLVLDLGGTTRDEVLRCLLEGLARYMEGKRLDEAWFLYIDSETSEILRQSSGFETLPFLLTGEASISLPGSCFEDYLASVPASVRSRVRADRRRFARAGYDTAVSPLTSCVDEVGRLVANLQREHGHQGDDAEMADLLRRQAEEFGDAATVHACRDAQGIVGSCVVLQAPSELASRACGFDYSRLINMGEYFELAYYSPIDQCYKVGVDVLQLGIGTYTAKIRRGASLALRWGMAFSLGGSPRGPIPDERVRAANAAVSSRLADEGLRYESLRAVDAGALERRR